MSPYCSSREFQGVYIDQLNPTRLKLVTYILVLVYNFEGAFLLRIIVKKEAIISDILKINFVGIILIMCFLFISH